MLCLWFDQSEFVVFMVFRLWIGPRFYFWVLQLIFNFSVAIFLLLTLIRSVLKCIC